MANVISTVSSLTRLDNVITSMTRRQHRAMVNIVSVTPSSTQLSNDITPKPMSPQQCHCQHWLGSAVTSITQGLDEYFLDEPSDSEVHQQALRLEEYHSIR
jgi:hypothetical protein